jgi:hypothetical protein
MPTLDQIQTQLQKLDGVSSFLAKKEIKELPNILWHDEEVKGLIQGMYNNGNGLLVGTNSRLIFINKKLLGGIVVEDFPYDKISSIQYETGLLFGKITIFTSGNKALIEQTDKKQARTFCDEARERISNKSAAAAPVPVAAQPGTQVDVADQLQKLAALKEKGILTEEEFQAQKKKLLGM